VNVDGSERGKSDRFIYRKLIKNKTKTKKVGWQWKKSREVTLARRADQVLDQDINIAVLFIKHLQDELRN